MNCTLTDFGLIKIHGKDAKKFLQGQLTCNMDDITTSVSRMGAHCNREGRVLSLFYIFLLEEAYYLLMPNRLIETAIAALKKYVIFYQTTLTEVSHEFIVLGYTGDKKKIASYQKNPYTIIETGKRCLLVGDKEIMKEMEIQLTSFSPIISKEHWKKLDMHDGIPAIYPETSGKFLPHEINLEKLEAIHFNKGCYTGQEIIARMHYKAKLKNHLYLARMKSSATLLPGTEVYSYHGEERKASGTLVDVCPHHDEVLLVTSESHAKNDHLFLENNDKIFFTIVSKV
jgi:folate-binding protein YgfZ